MVEQPIVTQTIPVSQARQRLGELVNQVYRRRIRVIVEKSGIPVAALVSLADLEHCLGQEEETAVQTEEVTSMGRDKTLLRAPTKEELARRQALVSRILAKAEGRVISPLTSADLVHRVREEERKAHERGAK